MNETYVIRVFELLVNKVNQQKVKHFSRSGVLLENDFCLFIAKCFEDINVNPPLQFWNHFHVKLAYCFLFQLKLGRRFLFFWLLKFDLRLWFLVAHHDIVIIIVVGQLSHCGSIDHSVSVSIAQVDLQTAKESLVTYRFKRLWPC